MRRSNFAASLDRVDSLGDSTRSLLVHVAVQVVVLDRHVDVVLVELGVVADRLDETERFLGELDLRSRHAVEQASRRWRADHGI